MQPSQVSQSLWRFFYIIGKNSYIKFRNRKCSKINVFRQLSTSGLRKYKLALL